MPSRLNLLIDLLHAAGEAALATQSTALPGFPFASYLPFVPDEQQRPVFFISRLAEHTQNLLKDDRASLLLRQPGSGPEVVRATLVGHVRPVDADDLLRARYLRYQPEAEQFLDFADFRFFRLEPVRARTIGGFAQAGWLDGGRLTAAPALAPAEEAGWIEQFGSSVAADAALLGIDPFGVDLRRDGRRERLTFRPGPVVGEAVGPALARCLAKRKPVA